MAIQSIIDSIDTYIEQLQSARNLLAGYSKGAIQDRKLIPRPDRDKKPAAGNFIAPSISGTVAVQVLPPKMPRKYRRSKPSAKMNATALGGAVPRGPVVVRPAEAASIAAQKQQAQAARQNATSATPEGLLQELANEVSRRLLARNRS